MKSFSLSYPAIPTTFEGELLHEARGEKPAIKIGEKYYFEQLGMEALVEDAVVVEDWKKAACIILTEDGQRLHINEDLSDLQLEDYKAHPEAFFGVIKEVNKNIQTHTEAFKFFYDVYKKTSKEKLLEWLASHPQSADWTDLSQEELVRIYCDLHAAEMMKLK